MQFGVNFIRKYARQRYSLTSVTTFVKELCIITFFSRSSGKPVPVGKITIHTDKSVHSAERTAFENMNIQKLYKQAEKAYSSAIC